MHPYFALKYNHELVLCEVGRNRFSGLVARAMDMVIQICSKNHFFSSEGTQNGYFQQELKLDLCTITKISLNYILCEQIKIVVFQINTDTV